MNFDSRKIFNIHFFLLLFFLITEYSRLTAMFPFLGEIQFGMIITLLAGGSLIFRIGVGKKLYVDKVHYLLGIYLLVIFLSWVNVSNTQVAWIHTKLFINYALFSFLIMNIIDNEKQLKVFLLVYLLLLLKLSVWQIRSYDYHVLQNEVFRDLLIERGLGGGFTGFLGNAGDFGVAMVVTIPFALYWMAFEKNMVWKFIYSLMALSFVLSIVHTSSRASGLGLLGILALIIVRGKRKLLGLVLGMACLVVIWGVSSDIYKNRFYSIQSYEKDENIVTRLDLWRAGLGMIAKEPLAGVGIGHFGMAYAGEHPGERSALAPHNIFIQAGSELGVIGLGILVLFIIGIFKSNNGVRNALKNDSVPACLGSVSKALDASLLGFLITGFFITTLYYPHLYLISGLSGAVHKLSAEKESC